MKNEQIMDNDIDRKRWPPSQTIFVLAITATIFGIITIIVLWITKSTTLENIFPIILISVPVIISGLAVFLAVHERRQESKRLKSEVAIKETALSKPSKPLFRSLLRLFVKSNLYIAIIGAILGIFLAGIFALTYNVVLGPPPDTIVTNLMDQEAQVAITRDVNSLPLIYASDAVIVDAGCQPPGPPSVWVGLTKITERYSNLPPIISLEHLNVHVTWQPNDSSATHATATSDMIGTALINGSPVPLRGHEQWTFAKINGQWNITLYTYNFCHVS